MDVYCYFSLPKITAGNLDGNGKKREREKNESWTKKTNIQKRKETERKKNEALEIMNMLSEAVQKS